MKTFKDLKVGDYMYFIVDDEIKKYSITSIEKNNFFDLTIYIIRFCKKTPWIYVRLTKDELNKSKINYQYEDPGFRRHLAYAYTTKEELLNELYKRREKLINEINKQIIFAEKL